MIIMIIAITFTIAITMFNIIILDIITVHLLNGVPPRGDGEGLPQLLAKLAPPHLHPGTHQLCQDCDRDQFEDGSDF